MELDKVKPNHPKLGPLFKNRSGSVAEALSALTPDQLPRDGSDLELTISGEQVRVPSDCYQVVKVKEKVSGVKVVPHVIEPSYGVDRILYAILDHAYHKEGDYVRLKLAGKVAPVKIAIFPLVGKDGLDTRAMEMCEELTAFGVNCYYDDSGSIGRRYARMDEIGTPFCVTVDYDTLKDETVTVRDRDTSEQVRVSMEQVKALAAGISKELSFEEVKRGI